MGSSHPVCPSSGTSWWAILGPVAFPPLAITLPQRAQLPFSRKPLWIEMGAETCLGWSSPCSRGWRRVGAIHEEPAVRGCQGNAGGMSKWALTVAPPPQTWGRQGLTLSWTPPPPACRPTEGCLGVRGALGRAGQGAGASLSQTPPSQQAPRAGPSLQCQLSAFCLALGREAAEARAERAAGRDGSHTALSLSLSPCPLPPALGLAKLNLSATGRVGPGGAASARSRAQAPRTPPPTHCLLGSLGLRGSRC